MAPTWLCKCLNIKRSIRFGYYWKLFWGQHSFGFKRQTPPPFEISRKTTENKTICHCKNKQTQHSSTRLVSSRPVSSPFPPNRILLLVVSVDGLAWKRQTTTKRRDAGKEEETESFPLLPLFLLLFWSFILFLMVRTETTTSVLPSTNNRIVTERERERERASFVLLALFLCFFFLLTAHQGTHTQLH